MLGKSSRSFRPLRQNLELVLRARIHHVENFLYLVERELSVKYVRHAVDENALWFPPCERLHQAVIPKPRSERVGAVLLGVFDWQLPEIDVANFCMRERKGVAVIAAG